MNLFSIFKSIESIDPEVYERLGSRRDMFNRLSSMGTKAAMAAVPIAMGSMFNKAYGKGKASVAEVLNYALTLEYLEDGFYKQALEAEVMPTDRRAIFLQISKHESAHVDFLIDTLESMEVSPVGPFQFDYTAGGAFENVFSDYNLFLTVAQALEDTGVRAYKGRAAELMSNKGVLTAALQIHSVEARHASMIRRLRGKGGWITGVVNDGAPAAIYTGEDNITQGGASITSLGYTAAIATQAFDEPLTPEAVLDIIEPFMSPS